MNLSPKMRGAMRQMRDQGDLVRLSGGWWTYRGCEFKPKAYIGSPAVPIWYVEAHTIKALLRRELVSGSMGFPGSVTLTEAGVRWLIERG